MVKITGKWRDLEKIILSEVTQTQQNKQVHSFESIVPSSKSADVSGATIPHQRSVSLQQMSTFTENHTGHKAEINRLGLGEPSPKWLHLHHRSYI